MYIYTIPPCYTAQPTVTIEFTELDFQEVENAGKIDVTLSATGSTSIDLGLVITPFTLDEYRTQFGRPLPDKIAVQSMGLRTTRAECELFQT